MKFTLAWLKDHLDTTATLEQISTTLSSIGLEVESIDDPAQRLKGFVVVRVLKAEQHPNADKLRVCQVETGSGTLQVVCGAPNARTGLIGVFAPEGTYIPGTAITLAKTKIRGVESNGMLCSERELELSNEHDGIIELPAELGTKVGRPYAEVMAQTDPVIEIKITPNRPDCLGVRGIARDLAATGLGKLKPAPKGFAGRAAFEHSVAIELRFPGGDTTACPAFASRIVRGVENGPSPAWLQQRLKAIGLRPISALVDITNYITFDQARPLHVYDTGKLTGTIHARAGKVGESFAALDGKTYAVADGQTVIADDKGVLGFGGIIGGESSGCDEATTSVLIESAYFDPIRTAVTGRQTGIRSDARYRFERGIDPQSCVPGIELATAMILEICGGEASSLRVAGKPPAPHRSIDFTPTRVHSLAGLDVKEADSRRILETLGFAIEGKGPSLKVAVPTWRPDVHGAADLVEEVIRITGIDKVPSTPMPRVTGVAHAVLTEGQKRVRRLRRVLAGQGLVEAVTWSFVARDHAAAFGGGQDELELANPISSEMTHMRPSLLPGLLAAAQRNQDRGLGDLALFELGQCYRGDRAEDQTIQAAAIRLGRAGKSGIGRHWEAKAADADLFDVKADAGSALAAVGLDINRLQVTRDASPWYHPGRSAAVRLGPKVVIAQFGELHPRVLAALGVTGRAVAFELFLDAVPAAKKKPTKARPPLDSSDLQPVRRDFAFVVGRNVAAGDAVRAAEGVDRKLISGVAVFDVFEGGNLGEDRKSIALEVTLQPRERTLTDEEIEAVGQKIIGAVKKATGGEIRG